MSLQSIPTVSCKPLINGYQGYKRFHVDINPVSLRAYNLLRPAKSANQPCTNKCSKMSPRPVKMLTFAFSKNTVEESNLEKEEPIVKPADGVGLSDQNSIVKNSSESSPTSNETLAPKVQSKDVGELVSTSPSTPSPVQQLKPMPSNKKPNSSVNSPLSNLEKQRTARTLAGFPESRKSSSFQPGKNILDAIKDDDKVRKSSKYGEPVNPSDVFKDPIEPKAEEKEKFEFKLGSSEIYILLSFFLISGLMLGTTYLVWKVGAIHYNEF